MSVAIPAGWATTTFDEIFQQVSTNGKKVKTGAVKSEGKFPVVDQGRAPISGYLDDESLVIVDDQPLIIFGDHTREIKWIDFPFIPGADGIKVLKPAKELSTRFMYFLLRDLRVEDKGYARHFKTLKDTVYRLPPPAEQARIAQKLDELLTKVDILKIRFDAIPALCRRFRKSVLGAAVSGRLTSEWRKENPELTFNFDAFPNVPKTRRGVPDIVKFPDSLHALKKPETWTWASAALLLKKGVFLDLKDGNHGAAHPKTSEFTPEGLPFITAANVSNNGTIDYESAPKVSGEALKKLRVGFSEPNDVIFTHKGTVGRVAVNVKKCVLTPQTTYYRLDQNIILSKYLSIFLQSEKFSTQIDLIKSQTTRDFVPITTQYELFHLIPPTLEQAEIVLRVEKLFAYADQFEAKVTSAKTRIDYLTQSILSKAFRGELVPQDPDEAPASAMLERIKARNAAGFNTKRAKKAKVSSAD